VTRDDLLDYYFEVERFDTEVGELLGLLEQHRLEKNTLVVITGTMAARSRAAKPTCMMAGRASL